MHTSFLPILADPATGEPLEVVPQVARGDRVLSGVLRSRSNEYPIVAGVPRFAGYEHGNGYTRSFGFQWNRWSRVQFESENVGGPMAGHTRKMWERICCVRDEELRQSTIVDVGCGSGRFIEVVREKGARVVGLDLSSAVDAAAKAFTEDDQVLICQADALRPPIRSASVDGAYSIGVLHHTPSPETGARAMAHMLRSGGWMALSVYGKGGFYEFPTVNAYRHLFAALWPVLGPYPAIAYTYATAVGLRPVASVPILGKAIRVAFPFVRLPDVRWSILDTFDALTPSHQSAHESYEVFHWLKNAGLVDIEPMDWGFTAYRARAPGVGGKERA